MNSLKISIIFLLFAFSLWGAEKPTIELLKATPEQRSLGCQEYYVSYENLPINKEFVFYYSRPMKVPTNEFKKMGKVAINEKGKPSCTFTLDPIVCARGEIMTFRLVDLNNAIIAENSYIPNPIISDSKSGTFSLTAELESIDPITRYRLHCLGIDEGEHISFLAICGEEISKESLIYSKENGVLLLPELIGKKSAGECYVMISRPATDDNVILELPYGDEIPFSTVEKIIDAKLISRIERKFYTQRIAEKRAARRSSNSTL